MTRRVVVIAPRGDDVHGVRLAAAARDLGLTVGVRTAAVVHLDGDLSPDEVDRVIERLLALSWWNWVILK